jgi:DNA-binding CsgD family transcriptional regulator
MMVDAESQRRRDISGGTIRGTTDLTSKEWAIIALVSKGKTDTQIAASIREKEPVVKDYLHSIFQKTGCWNRTEVALWYVKTAVKEERRSSERRATDSNVSDERRKDRRRRPTKLSGRANEQHKLNLDE